MGKFIVPDGMRVASLTERQLFYTQEVDIQKIVQWLTGRLGKTKFAVIIGKHTDIFPKEYKDDKDTTIIIDNYQNFSDVKKQILEFLPESVYYDRNTYSEKDKSTGQELAFDIDPENVICPVHGSLADKMSKHQGLSFCMIELEIIKDQTLRLYEYLQKQFSKLQIVYSGRGYHIHVFDQEAYWLTSQQRGALVKDVKSKGFAIDSWVTNGEMRLIRLPYSLHGMVSRIVLPLEKKEVSRFDPICDERCIPSFLQNSLATSF
jgi:DNA primase catalytic subunit